MEENQISNIEDLREYFHPKTESGTVLPQIRDSFDGTEFVLIEGVIKTPHKMVLGKWHKMVADGDSIIRYEEV